MFRSVHRAGDTFLVGLIRCVAGHAAGMTGAGEENVAVLMTLKD